MDNRFSYWGKKAFLSGYDVFIIGSGIVGLSAALHLKTKYPELNVGVLEAGFLPAWASTKNAGFACFGSISEVIEELKTVMKLNFSTLLKCAGKALKNYVKPWGIMQFHLSNTGGYEVFKNSESAFANECIDSIPYFNNLLKQVIGKHDIYAVSNDKIAGFGFSGINKLIDYRAGNL